MSCDTHVTITTLKMKHISFISESSLLPLSSQSHPPSSQVSLIFFPLEISSDKWFR